MKVKCPTCNTDVSWTSDQQFRPFCSDRCHKIDLGDWATESFKIAGETALDEFEFDDEDKCS